MRRVVPLATALLLGAVLAGGGCGDPDAPITVSPAEYDFGRVMQGQTRNHTFTLTNHGNRTVGFKVQPNCGCFGVSKTLVPLDPGQSLEFQVIFNTANREGQVKGKWVTIHTDHPEVPKIVLPITGTVYRAFDVRPPLFYMGQIDGSEANYEPRTVVIRPESGFQLRFLGFFATPQVVDATAESADDGSLHVVLRLRKDVRRPKGSFLTQVRLDLEVKDPDGSAQRQQAIVHLRGTWAL